MMNPQRFAVVAVLSLSAAYASERLAWFTTSSASSGAAAHVVDRLAPSLAANVAATTAPPAFPEARAAAGPEVASADVTSATQSLADVAIAPKPSGPETADTQPIVVATLTDPAEILPQTGANLAEPSPPDAAATAPRLELVGECMIAEACIDHYLFTLYERTPKEDTIKETERRKVAVKRKGKLVTVTRSFTRLVDNDFTWKDPKAAERISMPMIDYVIGGMDKSFKWKLFYMLQAAENAGLQPGITSAFRDDYRQSIAAGLKAASDRSYHGGSSRGGYGHGLAADIVSVNGKNRAQRWVSTEALWKWVDANGKQYGIGRPYLGRDPPHVGPIDGQEYVSRRGGSKAADVKKRDKQAAQAKPAATSATRRLAAAATTTR
jgi:hypothetical protein